MSAHQKLTPQTTTQRTAAHRRRMAEKMARMQSVVWEASAALLEYDAGGVTLATWGALRGAISELNPTDPAKS